MEQLYHITRYESVTKKELLLAFLTELQYTSQKPKTVIITHRNFPRTDRYINATPGIIAIKKDQLLILETDPTVINCFAYSDFTNHRNEKGTQQVFPCQMPSYKCFSQPIL